MPKKTFFNLSEEKKSRIIGAAIDEFSQNRYHQAAVTSIIDKADIARGSFYQYFEDKKDLFKYVLEIIIEQKQQYLEEDLQIKIKENMDFFQLLRGLYLSGIKFARDNPKLTAIGIMVVNEQSDIIKELMKEHQNNVPDLFEILLEQGVKNEDLDPVIDIKLVARFLMSINLSLGEIILEDGKIDLDDMVVVDKMIYIIKNGIKNNN